MSTCQSHIPCSFAYKVVCVDDKFSKPVVLYRGKNAINRFTEAIFKKTNYGKKIIKKHFMYAEDEERFQLSNICWKCDNLLDAKDNKVRDHCHVTGKYRGSAH